MILDPVAAYVIKTLDVASREKVFINVCTDEQVSPPATLDSSEIEMRALRGEDWIVPIVVSAGRKDTDKAGSVCTVYDCCMNPAVVLLGIENSGVKVLTVETCLELVEQSSGTVLDREYRFPRMKSKGKLVNTAFDAHAPHAQASAVDPSVDRTLSLEAKDRVGAADSLPELRGPPSAQASAPVVEVLGGSDSASPFYFHVYRGPFSGEGLRPSHVVEIEGPPGDLMLREGTLSSGSESLDLGFLPSKHDAFHSAEDNTTYIMIWRA